MKITKYKSMYNMINLFMYERTGENGCWNEGEGWGETRDNVDVPLAGSQQGSPILSVRG